MDFGAVMFSTDYSIRPDDLAKLLEDRGFESMWVPEHSHIPADRSSPWPGGSDLPREYWHCYDPFVALTAAAAVTTNLKLGTGICLVIERDPIMMAKEVAAWTVFQGGASSSVSAVAGTVKKWLITAPGFAAAGGCSGNGSWR